MSEEQTVLIGCYLYIICFGTLPPVLISHALNCEKCKNDRIACKSKFMLTKDDEDGTDDVTVVLKRN